MLGLNRANLKQSFYSSFCPPSALPSDNKKLPLTLPMPDLQRPTWGQSSKVGSILLYCSSGGPIRRSEGGGRMAEGVGRRQTADEWKFLLLFRTARLNTPFIFFTRGAWAGFKLGTLGKTNNLSIHSAIHPYCKGNMPIEMMSKLEHYFFEIKPKVLIFQFNFTWFSWFVL